MNRWLQLCTLVEDEYGDDPADLFGPRKLGEIRDLFVASGNSRGVVNSYVRRITIMFEHAVSRELIDVNILVRLQTLKPLRAGQTTAAEPKRLQPVPIEDVRAAAEFLSPQVRAIIAIQVSTGMRPSEVTAMRPNDIDRSGDEWFYRPADHKTAHHGVVKAVPIVDAARKVASRSHIPVLFCWRRLSHQLLHSDRSQRL